jgi:hypothetical protein
MTPVPEHTSKVSCGFTIGDATATPNDNTNHASTRRVRSVKWRRVRMARIIVYLGIDTLD